MTPRKIISFLLEKEIGISETAVEPEIIDKAIRKRMMLCGTDSTGRYLDYIHAHPPELNELVELTVVPETWFFRNAAAFHFLEEYVQDFLEREPDDTLIRVLSIPCSTGEEAWSAAITFAEAGIPESRYCIDAVDVSANALEQARSATYGIESFREEEYLQREIYFASRGSKFQVRHSLRSNVRFIKGNLLDEDLLKKEKPYHIIFCRNLLIYLSATAKNRAAVNIERLLLPKGILFLGHAEQAPFHHSGFVRLPRPRAFAWQKTHADESARPRFRTVISSDRKNIRSTEAEDPPDILSSEPGISVIPDSAPLPLPEEKKQTAAESCKTENPLEKARCLADQGELDEAFRHCRIFLENNPVDAEAYFLMGMIFHAVGNEKETEKYLNRVIYLDPGHCDALEQLWLIAEHRGDSRRAEHLRQRIRRLLTREDTL